MTDEKNFIVFFGVHTKMRDLKIEESKNFSVPKNVIWKKMKFVSQSFKKESDAKSKDTEWKIAEP